MEKKYLQNATDLGHWLGSLFPELGQVKGVAIVRTLFNGIAHSLYDQVLTGVADPHVQIQGFGSTRVIERQPRQARNPKTGAQIKLDKRLVVKWTPSDSFKSALNDPKGGEAYFQSLPMGMGDSAGSTENGSSPSFNKVNFESAEGVDRAFGRGRTSLASIGGGSNGKRGPGRPAGSGSSTKKKAKPKKPSSKPTSKTSAKKTPSKGKYRSNTQGAHRRKTAQMGGGNLVDLSAFLKQIAALAGAQVPRKRGRRPKVMA